ncbi:MAG: tetratricopeptide repeat protein [Acidobacteriota bacterium]
MANPEAEDHYYLGVDLIVEGKTDEAISEYLKAIELDPNLIDALHGLTRAYFQKGELDNAVHYAKRIAEADPDDVLAHTNLSIYYQQQGKIEEAEEEANKARILGWKQQLKKDQK